MKPTILFILPSYGGGAERVAVNIFDSLDVNYNKYLVFLNPAPKFSRTENNIIYMKHESVKSSIMSLYRFLLKLKPTHVFTTNEHVSVIVEILRLKFNFKHIVRLPTLPSNQLSKKLKSRINGFLFRIVIKRATAIICQSDLMRVECLNIYNTKPSKTYSIPNLVNKKAICTLSEESFNKENYNSKFKHLVFVGSIYPIKGLDILLRAFLLLKKRADIRLHILGEFKSDQKYNSLVQSLIDQNNAQSDRVFQYGFIKNPYPYIKNADLLVLSSRKEGFPNVVLESLLLKTPVVVTDCTDYSNILTTQNSIMIPVDDYKQLAQAIINGLSTLSCVNFLYKNFNYNNFFRKMS